MKKRVFTLALLVLCCASLLMVPALAAEIPEPTASFYANDFAGVLSSDTEKAVVSVNDQLYPATSAQVVVVTVDFLDGANIENYAYQLFNDWGIGTEDSNRGVLLLLVIGEENYWCVQGTGLQDSLDSTAIKEILNTYLEPDFAAGDYDAGVRKTVQALSDQITSLYGGDSQNAVVDPPVQQETSASGIPVFLGVVIVLFVVIVMMVVALSLARAFRPRRRGFFGAYPPPPRGPRYHRPPHYPPPGGPRGPRSGGPRSGGFGGFGGGFTGGGAGRGGFGGGAPRSGGGGGTRGGGAGRG